uniref:ADA32 protein n=1 Tax=Anas platyrhynchos TaxID=8839 RepID=A0A8B9ZG39_ANAPL
RPYTIHLQQHTCSGLRGLLQFENASYGIEPLVNSPIFEHFVHQMSNENTAGFLFAKSRAESGARPAAHEMVLKIYNYMGSDKKVATWKIIQIFNLVNNIFNPLNMTIVLSSLEFWIEENKISTAGEADELLQRFLERQQPYLALRSYDIACLFVYRDRASFAGVTIPGKACQRDAAGAYQRSVTLESFSVLLAQMLARSLGMSYDNNRSCHCPGHICVMNSEARVGGAKAFSSCSVKDFENFLELDAGDCLFDRPRLAGLSYRQAAACGNGVVERGEQCDCGSEAACLKDKCCTKTCRFKPGVKCSSGLCCDGCQQRTRCAALPADVQCDLAEYCDGSSASCPPDLYVQDGHDCEHGTGYCYKGRCQSADLQCRRLYGTGSKSAPVACYEEVNSQRDRFGHCGVHSRYGYRACMWRNLRCGKLICTYPYSTPFATDAAAVLYVQVREHLCISLDYLNVPARLDPLMIPPGTKCGSGKVRKHFIVCTNQRRCHCHPGWKPPDCSRRGSALGGRADGGPGPAERGESRGRARRHGGSAGPSATASALPSPPGRTPGAAGRGSDLAAAPRLPPAARAGRGRAAAAAPPGGAGVARGAGGAINEPSQTRNGLGSGCASLRDRYRAGGAMGLRLALLAAMLAASREWGRGCPVGPGSPQCCPGLQPSRAWPGMVPPGVVVGMLRGGGGP